MKNVSSIHGVAAKNGTRAKGYAWYVVFVLLVAYTLAFLDRMVLNLLVEDIRKDLSISDLQISLLQGMAFALLYVGAGIPLGRLVDTCSRQKIMTLGVLFWSAATALCGTATTFWGLFIARMGVGIGEAVLVPASYSLLTDYFSRDSLGRALSVFSSGIWIGSGLALIAGGAVLDFLLSVGTIGLGVFEGFKPWQIAFFLVGLPGGLVALLLQTVREPVRSNEGELPEIAKGEEPVLPFSAVVSFIKSHRRFFAAHFGGFAVFTLLAQAVLSWSPTLLIRVHGLGASTVGYWLGALYLIFSVAGICLGGVLSDRLVRRGREDGPMLVGAVGTLCLAPGTILFALAPDVALATLGGAVMALFISMPIGVAAAGIQIVAPARMRGQLSAVYLFVVTLIGFGLGPTAVAFLNDYLFMDPRGVAWSLSGIAAICGPLGFVLLMSGAKSMRHIGDESQKLRVVC